RNILIGIIFGVVRGVMVGATVVAPGLKDARLAPSEAALAGSENLSLDAGEETPQPPDAGGAAQSVRPSSAAARNGDVQRLRIISLFPPKLPILGDMAAHIEQALDATAGGPVSAQIYAPGSLVPAADSFDAVASGTVEAVFSSPGGWAQDAPVLQLFTAVPFGPPADEMLAWYYGGGGRELLQDRMAALGVHAILCGAIPPEGAGWFMAPIRRVEDFEGLTIRAYGLGADVLRTLGATVVDLDAGGILAGFEARTLDGAEYSLPAVDKEIGFHRFARHYYFPVWHQPATFFTLAVNRQTWDGMSPAAQRAVEGACGDTVRFTLARAQATQFDALKDLGLIGVDVRRWPAPVLKALKDAWARTRRDMAAKDPAFAQAWTSLQRFTRDQGIWRDLSRP
ncbi:MAG: hypothetical protein HUJ11_01695, partial [Arenibacter algicola]|nr:hypothetical protein [Arenibacter algicola]